MAQRQARTGRRPERGGTVARGVPLDSQRSVPRAWRSLRRRRLRAHRGPGAQRRTAERARAPRRRPDGLRPRVESEAGRALSEAAGRLRATGVVRVIAPFADVRCPISGSVRRSRCGLLQEAVMRLIATFVLAGGLCPAMLGAQTFKSSTHPVSDTLRELLARDSKNLVASADLMPADKYGYHPTAAQMT